LVCVLVTGLITLNINGHSKKTMPDSWFIAVSGWIKTGITWLEHEVSFYDWDPNPSRLGNYTHKFYFFKTL
jgi:hypothetical protein